MSHFFIADLHYGHNNIHKKFRCKFETQEEHDTTIHKNILSTGGSNNVLWILGDSFFRSSEFWRLDEYAKAFQKVNIVLGNHCAHTLPRYALQFNNVNVFGVVQRFGVWLTHVPVPVYELDRGNCLHGHLHSMKVSAQGDEKGDEFTEHPNYFCVSCERIGYTPITLGAIKAIKNWPEN